MIRCNKCEKKQKVGEYYNSKGTYKKTCKTCIVKEYRTIPKLIRVMYNSQVANSKDRGYKMEITKKEFFNWILNHPKLKSLYNSWRVSGWNTYLRPSIDRLDDYGTYNLNNIRLVTWRDNLDKAIEDVKSGVNHKNTIRIKIDGVIYNSKSIASRELGITFYEMNILLNGEIPKSGSFKKSTAELVK